MAGDWIKMRASLETNPKVIAIAKQLESDKAIGRSLSNGFGGALREIVTRDVTRDVTVMSLFRVWCAANEHTSDGVWRGIELDDLDHLARIKGFGRMMESVGWAVFDVDNNTVTFPNFLEYNAPAKEGRDKGAAERQRRYREKQRLEVSKSDVTRDVTLRVTRDAKSDVEKRREEKSINSLSHDASEVLFPAEFQAEEFQVQWLRWKRHLFEAHKTYTSTTEQNDIYDLARMPIEDAIASVKYSIDKGAKNLIKDGSHKLPVEKPKQKNHPASMGIKL